jgi:1-acyl-sn-glycerol-3-phosphate acyltransferase
MIASAMRLSYRLMRQVAHGLFVFYGRGRVFGLGNVPATGPILLASNHQSFFDPILAALALPREVHFMARDTLFRNRYFRWLITHLNAFPVKRASADVGAIKEALRRLKAGVALVTFPEGTRTHDGRIRALHPGIFAIARRANCTIVPTIIEGAHEIWPRNQRLPGLARIWVAYGEPVSAEQLAGMELEEAAAVLTERLRTEHNALRRRIGRPVFGYEEAPVATADGSSVADPETEPARA